MTTHQNTAYADLLNISERLRAMISSAHSYSHPLALPEQTLKHLTKALNELHAAQRSIETI
jgi:hypothetical protein